MPRTSRHTPVFFAVLTPTSIWADSLMFQVQKARWLEVVPLLGFSVARKYSPMVLVGNEFDSAASTSTQLTATRARAAPQTASRTARG